MLAEIARIEKLRKRVRNHFVLPGRVLGCLIILSYFTLVPHLLRIMWPWLISLDLTTMYVGSIFALNIGIFAVYNLIMYGLALARIPFFEKFKNTSRPWPWVELSPENWKKLFRKSILFISINFFVITPLMVWITLQSSLPYEFSLEAWPSTPEILSQFFFFLLVEDALFYWAHRMMHLPRFYWIHKHHHEYLQTIGLANQYVHPIEYIISGTIPTSMGFQLLSYVTKVHYATVLSWVFYRLIQSYEGHSGYTWSWSTFTLIPFTVGSDHHDFHHSANRGNFGSVFLFWDALCNTQKPFVKHLEE